MRRPARVRRPQVYMPDYITTSFGLISKQTVKEAVLGSLLFLAVMFATIRIVAWVVL